MRKKWMNGMAGYRIKQKVKKRETNWGLKFIGKMLGNLRGECSAVSGLNMAAAGNITTRDTGCSRVRKRPPCSGEAVGDITDCVGSVGLYLSVWL